jgi:hypothetical protein
MTVVTLVGGVAIGVGPESPTNATHRITSAKEVDGWLGWLVREFTRPMDKSTESENPMPELVPVHSVVPAEDDDGTVDGPGVLILDQDPGSRAASAAALRRRGWRVWPMADATAAVDAVRQHAGVLRAAVVDLQLTGFESRRVLTAIQHDAPHVTRYGLTSGTPSYAVAAFQRQSDIPLLGKPIDPDAVSH